MPTLEEYYRDPAVRRQMVRFLGGETIEEATAAYITASGPGRVQYDPKPVEELPECLDRRLDIGRSLWDRAVLMLHLDIDYVNFTFPAEADVRIPDFSGPADGLIRAYRGSALADFHARFYSQEQEPPSRWPETYDAAPIGRLPPCGRQALERPCDLLMQPDRIRHVVRLLLSEGWHPRHVAGLIRSKYERDHGWGEYGYYYDATSRADFYTRLFAGLFFAGRDELVDFNCRSAQEKGYCAPADCTGRLEPFREALLRRRSAHV